MSELILWPDLPAAWEVTGTPEGTLADGVRWIRLQDKPRSRVLRLDAPGVAPQVLKIYAVPPHLYLRTLGVSSRANREFTLMMEAHRQALPVARPRCWLEHRILGGLRFSALGLDALEGPDLETLLRDADTSAEQRLALARAAGDLLGRFHRAGLYWATAAPRNLLLTGATEEPMLRAIDFPYGTLSSAPITDSHEALLDLACLLRMRNGDLAFDTAGRDRLVLAYCRDDVAAARALDERIVLRGHHSWRVQRLKRRLRNLLAASSRCPGRAGRYHGESGDYVPLKRTEVCLQG